MSLSISPSICGLWREAVMVSSSLSIILSLPTSSIHSNSTSDLYSTPTSLRPILTFRNNSKPVKISPFLRFSFQQSSKVLAFSSNNKDGSAEQFLENNSVADFMRFKRGSDRSSGELQTAVVGYRKRFPRSILYPFFQIDLVSSIHIADKEYALLCLNLVFVSLVLFKIDYCRYFATLQKDLEPYDYVLYEMVVTREAENWCHADLDYETFKLLQLEKGESLLTFARDMTLKPTKVMVQPTIPEKLGPWRSKLLWASRVLPMPLAGLFIIGTVCDVGSPASEYPELEALSRLDFGAAMKVFLAKRLTSEFTQVKATSEEESVIIGERNKAAIEALRRAINKGHNRIAILYGGGHMPDLGRRLREEIDLIPCRVQ
ncbi:hypothetical protein SADUNF_Sadunf06G0129200 [Salix dunnii]|uniref:Uncharacterized protein n=1 Tax=Salix dunnii TaxID=1413687 RepID=A0A835N311_9ROSI|nr:hypothetical protein SADUNF_Sadunf06G0129200 [Salix dunnii]